MGKIIAIDLGTTTSEVAYMKDGVPHIIKNEKYSNGTVLPSVVTIKPDEIVVGKKAKRQLIIRPESTIAEVKRHMGTDKVFKINGQDYMPEQISAMILKTLKEIAEEEIGEVDEAVITVPANFNDTQRAATKNAAAIAGLKVERMINEPTAAALGYGLSNLDKDVNILVYDLGGGTFDCTVLEMFAGIMDVKASRGDNYLGGKDFDKVIEDYIIQHIARTTKVDTKNISVRKLSEIKEAAENAKKDLSVENSTEIILNNFGIDENGDSIDVELELTKSKLNELSSTLINRSKQIVNETLEAANISTNEIDVVLAVGGSSRMDSVQCLLAEMFGKDKIQKGINPDEAVAIGAAVQAGIKSDEISSETGLIITDACSHTIGIEIVGERFSPLIYRDAKLPCKASDIYFTSNDNQTSVLVSVYQGESANIKNNDFVGEYELTGIPPAPVGEEKIEVTFECDLNGMLKVSTKVLSTQKVMSEIMSTTGLKPQEINKLAKDTFKDGESKESNNGAFKESSLYQIVQMSYELAESKLASLSGNDKAEVEVLLTNIRNAINSNNRGALEKLDDQLTDKLFDLN